MLLMKGVYISSMFEAGYSYLIILNIHYSFNVLKYNIINFVIIFGSNAHIII